MKVPPWLSTGEIARACELNRQKVVRELRSVHLLDKPGRFYRVSASRLRERLPDHYDRVYAFFVLEGGPPHRRSSKVREGQGRSPRRP